MNKPVKAVVAEISFAGFKFPGLKLPNGEYAIAIPQVAEIFSLLPNNATRSVKALLQKESPLLKSNSNLHAKAVNIIFLSDFGRLVNAITRTTDKAYEKARELAFAIQDASVTTTIEQAFDIAFNEQQKLEAYQEKVAARVQSKITRRTFTDAIADYIKRHPELSDNYKKFIYSNCSDCIYRLVFGRSAKKLKEDWCCGDVREALEIGELMVVMGIEDRARMLVDQFDIEPLKALKDNRVSSLLTVSSR